jgi:hypothetical protein
LYVDLGGAASSIVDLAPHADDPEAARLPAAGEGSHHRLFRIVRHHTLLTAWATQSTAAKYSNQPGPH